jgi:hypothetical protein
MKEVIITEWDDYDLLHDGRKVHAPNTVLIGIDGKWREMDLSDENLARLHDNLDPWWLCGRTPEKEVGKGALDRGGMRSSAMPAVGANGTEPAAGEGKRGSPERRAYLAGLRKWATARGLNYTTKPTDGNSHASYYYPKSLIDAYNEYLEQEAVLRKAEASQDPDEKAS